MFLHTSLIGACKNCTTINIFKFIPTFIYIHTTFYTQPHTSKFHIMITQKDTHIKFNEIKY